MIMLLLFLVSIVYSVFLCFPAYHVWWLSRIWWSRVLAVFWSSWLMMFHMAILEHGLVVILFLWFARFLW